MKNELWLLLLLLQATEEGQTASPTIGSAYGGETLYTSSFPKDM